MKGITLGEQPYCCLYSDQDFLLNGKCTGNPLSVMKIRPATHNDPRTYSPAEERLNVCSHAAGAFFSVIALFFLLLRASSEAGLKAIASFSIFGISLVLLYVISTLYHLSKNPVRRKQLRIIDHVTIFVLIAGTYTPFALLILKGWVGWTIFTASWVLALIGSALKVFYTGKYAFFSTLMYVLMGWMIVFAIIPLTENLSSAGLAWLEAGGLLYSIGAVLYCIRKIPYNHAIFHCFVLLGSLCHFVSVYYYVLPPHN